MKGYGMALDTAHVAWLLKQLKHLYPDAKVELDYRNAFELAVATVLSAQCTDVRVNKITPALFRKFPDAAAMAKAFLPELEAMIHSAGFYHNKAKNLLGLAETLMREFGGVVPDTMEALLTLPGVARKTANVILGSAFHKAEGVVVDTHVKRLAQRLGLSREETPEKIERDLMSLIPRRHWVVFSHWLIWHGRRVCFARKPKCAECGLQAMCPSAFMV
jgi:endonuclease-3